MQHIPFTSFIISHSRQIRLGLKMENRNAKLYQQGNLLFYNVQFVNVLTVLRERMNLTKRMS